MTECEGRLTQKWSGPWNPLEKDVGYLAQDSIYRALNTYLGDRYEAEILNECMGETLIPDVNTCASYKGITMRTQRKLKYMDL